MQLRKFTIILVLEIFADILSFLIFLFLSMILLWRGPLFIYLCRNKGIQTEVLEYYMSDIKSTSKEAITKLSYFKKVKLTYRN